MRQSRLDGSQSDLEAGMQVVFQAESYETLFAAAVAGADIAALRKFLAGNYVESGALRHLLPEWIFSHHSIYLALPIRKFMPVRTGAFVDFASERVLLPDAAGEISGKPENAINNVAPCTRINWAVVLKHLVWCKGRNHAHQQFQSRAGVGLGGGVLQARASWGTPDQSAVLQLYPVGAAGQGRFY